MEQIFDYHGKQYAFDGIHYYQYPTYDLVIVYDNEDKVKSAIDRWIAIEFEARKEMGVDESYKFHSCQLTNDELKALAKVLKNKYFKEN